MAKTVLSSEILQILLNLKQFETHHVLMVQFYFLLLNLCLFILDLCEPGRQQTDSRVQDKIQPNKIQSRLRETAHKIKGPSVSGVK